MMVLPSAISSGNRYMFVDGGALDSARRRMGESWFGSAIEVDYVRLQGDNEKVFYYDCLPAKNEKENDAEFGAKTSEKLAFFDRLNMLKGWHVNQGIARHRKREPQQQKEVDVQITVDMMSHTFRRNMTHACFLTGDQDFAPLVEALVRDGMFVELLYPEDRTAKDLIRFADEAKPLNIDLLYSYASEEYKIRHPAPSSSSVPANYAPQGTVIRKGYSSNGDLVALVYQDFQGFFMIMDEAVIRVSGVAQKFFVRHSKLALAERYYSLKRQVGHWGEISG